MIKVIGKGHCGACMMTKNVLGAKGIEFEYILLEEMTEEEQNNVIKMAEEQGRLSMPFIIKDGKLVTLQEVIA